MQKNVARYASRAWLALFIAGLLLTLAACGGSAPAASAPPATPTAAPTTAPAPTPTLTTAPAATPTTASSSSGNSISIANFAFSPSSLTVKAGTKVTWTNNDSVTHTVTEGNGAFNSGDLAPGSSFSFTFSKAGTYSYHCSIHPSMTATIVVQ